MLSGQGNFGFDASRKEYVDLVDAAIVDPVTKAACSCAEAEEVERSWDRRWRSAPTEDLYHRLRRDAL
jgi:chaperonin GroEL (HSP60 family)